MDRVMKIAWMSVAGGLLACGSLAVQAQEQVNAVCLVYQEGYWQAAALDVRSGRTRVLTRSPVDKTRLSWFPDGKLLLSRNDGTVTVLDVPKGTESEVRLEHRPVVDAVVNPGGTLVAFSFSTAIDGNDIWVLEWPSQKIASVVRMPHLQHEPTWAPDGRTVYFVSGDGGQAHDIWRYKTDTQEKEQLTVGQLYHFDVTVGPGGQLAYSSNRDGNYEIYLQKSDGKVERLTDDPALDARPTFAPDGRSLLFESSRSGTMQVHRLDIRSKRVTALTSAPGGARQPVWRGGRS